jgi:hypothetical protein
VSTLFVEFSHVAMQVACDKSPINPVGHVGKHHSMFMFSFTMGYEPKIHVDPFFVGNAFAMHPVWGPEALA